ncbi:MAG: HupE/UreJ family protein [Acidimicrobiia bacterium]|nr:HupE/UreJ family protein [Acidimicrobiia bacterium]
MFRALLILCVAAAIPRVAAAHPAPFSFLDLVIRDQAIDGVLVLHVVDIAHELGIEPQERLMDPDVVARERERIIALLTPRMTLRAGRELAIEWGAMTPSPERHGIEARFRIPVERPGSLAVLTRMFPYDPIHQTFVNIYEDEGLRQQLIFNKDSREYVFYTGTTQGAIAVMSVFIPSGIEHIMIGPDHILFLIGLLLLGGSWMALVKIVTAFTVGHSLTLSLAALNIVTPPERLIEPAIALSIVFVGADNLVRGTGRDVRAWVALVFGLVHGFGFANVLREFGLPSQALGWSLFSFNLGVEIGQLAIVLVVAMALVLIRRHSDALGHRVAWAGSIVVILAGAYWFVERVFFPA